MKLYLLTQERNTGYDTYDSCVVCAESEEDAKTIAPDGNAFKEDTKYGEWATKITDISCKEIGEANDNQSRGVICASYNAG